MMIGSTLKLISLNASAGTGCERLPPRSLTIGNEAADEEQRLGAADALLRVRWLIGLRTPGHPRGALLSAHIPRLPAGFR
jgi:hypothetical protein